MAGLYARAGRQVSPTPAAVAPGRMTLVLLGLVGLGILLLAADPDIAARPRRKLRRRLRCLRKGHRPTGAGRCARCGASLR